MAGEMTTTAALQLSLLLQLLVSALPAPRHREPEPVGSRANAREHHRRPCADGRPFRPFRPLGRRELSDASGFGVALEPAAYGPPDGCACFSFCHPDEVRAFFIRLPIVTSPASPWYDYLRAIYHADSVPLPVDLGAFGSFSFPHNARTYGQLPIPWAGKRCSPQTGRSLAPACARAECARWLNLSDAREAEARAWEAEPLTKEALTPLFRQSITDGRKLDPGAIYWPDGHLPFKGLSLAPLPRARAATRRNETSARGNGSDDGGGDGWGLVPVLLDGDIQPRRTKGQAPDIEPYVLMRWAAHRALRGAPAPQPGEWVEALRFHYGGSPEGILYGCWYTHLLEPFPRGTGVLVNVGKVLTFKSGKADAKAWSRQLRKTLPRAEAPHCGHTWQQVPADLALLARAAGPKGDHRAFDRLLGFGDNAVPACARDRGYDSIDMHSGASHRPELVLVSPACTWPGQLAPVRECGASETVLRTGWLAERECACVDGATHACADRGADAPNSTRPAPAHARTVVNCGRAPLCAPTDWATTALPLAVVFDPASRARERERGARLAEFRRAVRPPS